MLPLALFPHVVTPPWYHWPSRGLALFAWLFILVLTLSRLRRPIRLPLLIQGAGALLLFLAAVADTIFPWQRYESPFTRFEFLTPLGNIWFDPAVNHGVPALGAALLTLGFFFAWPPRHEGIPASLR